MPTVATYRRAEPLARPSRRQIGVCDAHPQRSLRGPTFPDPATGVTIEFLRQSPFTDASGVPIEGCGVIGPLQAHVASERRLDDSVR